MKASLLCFFLLCLLVAHSEVKGDEPVVKLCGREFIRAVTYTCGGSRWRRHVAGPAQDLLRERNPFYLFAKNHDSSESVEIDLQKTKAESEDLKDMQFYSEGTQLKRNEEPSEERRDLSHRMILACCQSGCNKKDLGSFC